MEWLPDTYSILCFPSYPAQAHQHVSCWKDRLVRRLIWHDNDACLHTAGATKRVWQSSVLLQARGQHRCVHCAPTSAGRKHSPGIGGLARTESRSTLWGRSMLSADFTPPGLRNQVRRLTLLVAKSISFSSGLSGLRAGNSPQFSSLKSREQYPNRCM